MRISGPRWLFLAGGIAILFVVTIVILLKTIPQPHRKVDHLVIGAVATFLSMILVWAVLLAGMGGPLRRVKAKRAENAALNTSAAPGIDGTPDAGAGEGKLER